MTTPPNFLICNKATVFPLLTQYSASRLRGGHEEGEIYRRSIINVGWGGYQKQRAFVIGLEMPVFLRAY